MKINGQFFSFSSKWCHTHSSKWCKMRMCLSTDDITHCMIVYMTSCIYFWWHHQLVSLSRNKFLSVTVWQVLKDQCMLNNICSTKKDIGGIWEIWIWKYIAKTKSTCLLTCFHCMISQNGSLTSFLIKSSKLDENLIFSQYAPSLCLWQFHLAASPSLLSSLFLSLTLGVSS